jgi:hypothetical protein
MKRSVIVPLNTIRRKHGFDARIEALRKTTCHTRSVERLARHDPRTVAGATRDQSSAKMGIVDFDDAPRGAPGTATCSALARAVSYILVGIAVWFRAIFPVETFASAT